MEENTNQNKQGLSPIVIIGIVIAIVGLGFGFIMMQSQSSSEMEQTEKNADSMMPSQDSSEGEMVEQAQGSEEMMEGEVQIVAVEAGSFYYKPNEIRVKKGQKVKIVMNSVSMMHDFVIDELGVKLPVVKDGDTGTVEFTADTVGSFEYYCSVGQHRANGQMGTLIVEE